MFGSWIGLAFLALAPASTRVRAADSVLDHAAKAIELEDIEARVSELEHAVGAAKDGRRFR